MRGKRLASYLTENQSAPVGGCTSSIANYVKLVSKTFSGRAVKQTIQQRYECKCCLKFGKCYTDTDQLIPQHYTCSALSCSQVSKSSLHELCSIVFEIFKLVEGPSTSHTDENGTRVRDSLSFDSLK